MEEIDAGQVNIDYITNHDLEIGSKGVKGKKRPRYAYTKAQLNSLLIEYQKNPYPSSKQREVISELTQVPADTVNVWFKNKRSKDKTSSKDRKANISHNSESSEPDKSEDSSTKEVNMKQIYQLSNSDITVTPDFLIILTRILHDAPEV